MTWTDLRPQVSDYGNAIGYLTTFLDVYNDERSRAGLETADEITDIYLTEAKAEVLRDLQVALRLNPDYATQLAIIDKIVDIQELRLRFAIALQQLIMAWDDGSQSVESVNHHKVKEYQKRYTEVKNSFPGLFYNQGSSNVTSIDLRT